MQTSILSSGGKIADGYMRLVCSGEECLQEVILRSILDSDEEMENSNRCCSVCSPDVPEIFPINSTPSIAPSLPKEKRKGRLTAKANVALLNALTEFRYAKATDQYIMRGVNSVLPTSLIKKTVKFAFYLATIPKLLVSSVPLKFA